MTASSQQPEGPASLDPRSPGCILTAVALAAAAVAGWLGLRLLEANSGEMALAAARRGVTTSGLAAPTQALLEAELVRVEEAHLAERLEPAEVIAAVDGLLQTPCLPWLRLRQVRDLDLPASGLADPDRVRLARDLDDLELMLRQGAITSGQASEVLGLETVEGGTAVVGDDELRSIAGRMTALRAATEAEEPAASEGDPGAALPAGPIEAFRAHVDTILQRAD